MRNRNLALAAMLAMTAMGGGMPAMTAATTMNKRPTREEEERAARERCDRKDALDAAEEKRKRKNAKRLADAKKVGAGRTATVTRAMLTAAHGVTLESGDVVLSARLLERIYTAMASAEKTHNA